MKINIDYCDLRAVFDLCLSLGNGHSIILYKGATNYNIVHTVNLSKRREHSVIYRG